MSYNIEPREFRRAIYALFIIATWNIEQRHLLCFTTSLASFLILGNSHLKMAESLSTDDRARRRREIEGKRAKVEELRRARAAREAERRANAVCTSICT